MRTIQLAVESDNNKISPDTNLELREIRHLAGAFLDNSSRQQLAGKGTHALDDVGGILELFDFRNDC